jgi:hypothetical protein
MGVASFYNLFFTVSSEGWVWKGNYNSRSCLDLREIVHSINTYSSFILQALVGSVCEIFGNRDLGGYLPSGIIFSVLFHPVSAYYCPKVLMFPSVCTRNLLRLHACPAFVSYMYYTIKSGSSSVRRTRSGKDPNRYIHIFYLVPYLLSLCSL